MNISKEVKIGLFGAVALTMLYFGFSFLKGTDFLSTTNTYYIFFDNIGALQRSNPVKLNGVRVGLVKSAEILQDQDNRVLVTLEVDNKIMLRKGTKAILTSELLGASTILLEVPTQGNELLDGDTLMTVKEAGIQELIQAQALPVLHSVDSLSKVLTKTVAGFEKTGLFVNSLVGTADKTVGNVNGLVAENQKTISALLKNIESLTASLQETEKGIKPILANLQSTTANLQTMTDSLKMLEFGKTLNKANGALNSLQKSLLALENGQGTAGKLLKDQTLYDNLNRTLVSVNKLMTNFREYPKRYVNVSVFGKKDKGPAATMADTTTK